MPRETAVVDSIKRAFKKRSRCLVRKNHPTYGTAGDPDLYGVDSGRPFAIEVKRPGEKGPTALQERRLQEWADAGAITGVARSADEALALLDAVRNRPDLLPGGEE